METTFYFNNVDQLSDFNSFDIEPLPCGHFWTVTGVLNENKAERLQGQKLPVADLPSELYARLFANLCEQVTGKA